MTDSLPAFFDASTLDLFSHYVRMLIIWGGPLILIFAALYFAEDIMVLIVGLFRKPDKPDKDDDDDVEVYRY